MQPDDAVDSDVLTIEDAVQLGQQWVDGQLQLADLTLAVMVNLLSVSSDPAARPILMKIISYFNDKNLNGNKN